MGTTSKLMDDVVVNDYCVGCGLCAFATNGKLKMILDDSGKYKPILENEKDAERIDRAALPICPFANQAYNEDEIGHIHFAGSKHAQGIGYYKELWAGYVQNEEKRKVGGSGGLGTWLLSKLLKEKLVDKVIHVRESKNTHKLFEYCISETEEELEKGGKSKYYPVELSSILDYVATNDYRYALVGIPCFIKAVRNLALQNENIGKRIRYFVGLVCGHMKSTFFAESLGMEMGIQPQNLTAIDFRKKMTSTKASNYGIEVKGMVNGQELQKEKLTKECYTTNWGYGFFKLKSCEFCDDVLAETADITIGDAWLPRYVKDSQGTNIIIVRNEIFSELFKKYQQELYLDPLDEEDVIESQISGIRHRTEGLAYRLYQAEMKNEWHPKKRIQPEQLADKKREKIYEYRYLLSQESFSHFKKAKNKGDFVLFEKLMNPLLSQYQSLNTANFFVVNYKKIVKRLNYYKRKWLK
ncbi:coenzyme F420 hydrogenase [Erwinia sp. CPCC 100877]|nr:coenzyme F420 hydrogenase [Erwinia sp. CPCC 100877]